MDISQISDAFKPHFSLPHHNAQRGKGKQGLEFIYRFSRELEKQDKHIMKLRDSKPLFSRVDIHPDHRSEFFINYPLDIIVASAKYLGLRVMCKDYIDTDLMVAKGFRIFGDTLMLILWSKIWWEYINKIIRYRTWLIGNMGRVPGYSNIRVPIRKEVESLHAITLQKLRVLTQVNADMDFKLEQYIMSVEKLAYKDYPGLPRYDHAITSKYHNKRMLI